AVDVEHSVTKFFDRTRRSAASATASQVGRQLIEDLECAAAAFQPESGKCEHIAARMLRRTNGRPSVASLANRLDVSERTLRRRFIAVLGMSPKTFARRLRVTGALLRAEKSSNPNWAQIAHAAGYHDQSHMIADFKLQTGMTPGETYAYRKSLSDFSNTAS
ncbi:MAG: helix-turn-helix domain-containing protein, partial [Marinicaulis sp.]|nr:helix-turn-helix domain-containing protein [Marinicaulis sp.]